MQPVPSPPNPPPVTDPALTQPPLVTSGGPPTASPVPTSTPLSTQPAPPLDPAITIQQASPKKQPIRSATALYAFVIAVKVIFYLPISPFILAGVIGYR